MRKLVSENTLEAFRILLKRLNVSFTESTIRQFKNHPEFPNLFSVSHTLTQLGIENLAFRPSYSDLQNELPKPLMVYTYDNGGMYLVLEGADSDKVYFVNEQDKIESLPKDDFLKSWSGIAVVAVNDKKVSEENYNVNAFKEFFHSIKYIVGVISLVSVVLYSIFYTTAFILLKYLFLFANGCGVAVSVLLSIQLIDKNNPFIKKLCASKNSKSSCNDILNSKAAYVFGLFAWSEIGLIYFLSLSLYLLFLSETNGLLIVSALALLSIPYPAYSVYYQWKVAKTWCKLCLLIQCVLFAEFVMALYYFASTASISSPSFKNYLLLFVILLSIVSTYSLLKPILSEWNLYKMQFPLLNKIKFNKEVFTQLVNSSRRVDTSGISPIVLGNAEAKTKLTVITNPICKPCVETHQKLFKLLQSKEDTAIREIFFTEPDRNDPSYKMAECMIRLHEAKGKDITKQALTEYYSNPKEKESWMKTFGDTKMVNTEAGKQLDSHIDWCFKNRFHSTPIILFNDYVLPDAYTIDDLEYLID
jgi:uncharacterized membrane protein